MVRGRVRNNKNCRVITSVGNEKTNQRKRMIKFIKIIKIMKKAKVNKNSKKSQFFRSRRFIFVSKN